MQKSQMLGVVCQLIEKLRRHGHELGLAALPDPRRIVRLRKLRMVTRGRVGGWAHAALAVATTC